MAVSSEGGRPHSKVLRLFPPLSSVPLKLTAGQNDFRPLKILKAAGHQIGDAYIPPAPHGDAMRIWIDGVPCTFEDVFKMAAEEIKEADQPS